MGPNELSPAFLASERGNGHMPRRNARESDPESDRLSPLLVVIRKPRELLG